MGSEVKQGYDGKELSLHRFDSHSKAVHYLTTNRGYKFERHETWAHSSGVALFDGPNKGERASLREKNTHGYPIWTVYFWTEGSR